MTNTTSPLEIYSINDADESDPDPIYEGDHEGMIKAFGDVSLDFLFHDDDIGTNVYNVVRADGVVVGVAYRD